MMNTTQPAAPVRQFVLVTLLSLACAFCTGCHSSAKASAPAAVGAAAAQALPWLSQAPAAPLDERPITPMETVAAAEV